MANKSNWYVLKVRTNFEALVVRELAKRNLDTELLQDAAKGNVKNAESLLLPGYVFCRFDLAQSEAVLSTPGVLCILGTPGPTPFDDGDLEALVEAAATAVPRTVITKRGVRSRRVRVITGPLSGLTGEVFELNGTPHLGLHVKMIDRTIAFQIDQSSVHALHQTSRPLQASAAAHSRSKIRR
jgi:transcription antitermination factor NusG